MASLLFTYRKKVFRQGDLWMSPLLLRPRQLRTDSVTFTSCKTELCNEKAPQFLVAPSLSAKKLFRKIPHTIVVIPCAPVVLRLVELETSLSLPRLSDCANREWFPLSIAPMPGPVNQVHKPKPLGEVLLLNSSQLLEFFFPLSLLIGESWAFPGVYLQEKEKKGAKDYCTGGE